MFYIDPLCTRRRKPIHSNSWNFTEFGPFEQTESNRYHNIVYPMLQVAVAILTNLGRNHRTATAKVFHIDVFHSFLAINRWFMN
jgi:hypothetical protein